MAELPWLSLMGLLPLIGAGVIWALPNGWDLKARQVALLFSVATFVVGLGMALRFDVANSGLYQFAEMHAWIPQLGVSYALGVNGLGLVMILLAALLVPVCVLAAWDDYRGNQARNFFALIMVLETFMVGVFAARDLFLFYVFFEAMLIPVYFLIGQFGGLQRRYAAVKFLLYSLAGGLIMLVGLIVLYNQGPGGPQGMLIQNLTGVFSLATSASALEKMIFLSFFLAFAIKAPMWPVHTWLPDAVGEAPPTVAVLLVGVLDKVGTFGMLTLCLPLFPHASTWAAPTIAALAVVSVLYGALLAIGQSDLMRLIAYTSISHFGFIVLGIFAMTSHGQSGSALYMVNHGFSTAALFLIAGMLIKRGKSARIDAFGGLQRVTPMLAGLFLIAGLSSLALPGLSSFLSEFLVLVGTYPRFPVAAVAATLGIILAALYILMTYQSIFTGPKQESSSSWKDLNRREVLVMAPILAIIIAMGFYPKPVLDVINPVVAATMHQVGVTDPVPVVPSAAEGTK